MTTSAFLSGLGLLAICVTPLASGARSIRRRALRSWTGPPALLVDSVVTLTLLLGILHVLGSVGWFRPIAVVASCVVAGIALSASARPRPEPGAPLREPERRSGGVDGWIAASGCALLAALWTTGVRTSFDNGIREYDSQWYHLSHAARWVQDGWLTGLHLTTTESADPFHPGDSELLHALGMLLFDGDVLSPVLNLGWLALALLAAWCVGRPWGVGAVTTTGVTVLLATPLLTATQAGTAQNDVAAMAAVLTIAALLVQPTGGRSKLAVAGAAAGLALGVKLTVAAPVAVLALGIPFVAPAGRRLAAATAWWVPMMATGSFWYLRNLFRSGGSPLPALSIPGLPSPSFGFLEVNGQTVAQHLATPRIWTEWFVPGLRHGIGPLWPVVLGAVGLGLAAAWRSRSTELRLLALATAAQLIAYAWTPTSACCDPDAPGLFALNFRYACPGLALGIAALAASPWGRAPSRRWLLLGGSTVVLVVLAVAERSALPGTSAGFSRLYATSEVAAAAAVLGVTAGGLRLRDRLTARPVVLLLATVVTVLAVGTGTRLQAHYAEVRYVEERWVEGLDARIALVGSDQQYPLYGSGLENRVQYVGARGPNGELHDITSCRAFLAALRAGGYDLLVLRPQFALRDGRRPGRRPEIEWAESDPSATLHLRRGDELIYRLDGGSDPATCP